YIPTYSELYDSLNNNATYSSRDTKSYEPQSTDYSRNYNYVFTLTEFGGKIEDGYREKDNPTEEDLKNAVDNLALYDGDFFTLIGNESINGYTMIGGMTVYGDKLLTASVHKETGVKNGKRIGKAYDKQVTPNELLQMIKDFMNCRTPNINDKGWVFDKDLEFPD
ncbi:MAG: hypothetical protein K2N18_05580, partial [Clostridia bacterium]|nr:hypothetical protein [Clostridia bacterium]